MSFDKEGNKSQFFQCPFCGTPTLTIKELSHPIPYFKETLLIWYCSNCGYRHVDIFPSKSGKPMRLILKVSSPKDLYAKIIRSRAATIKIPELGVIIEPGPAAHGFITNVEGVIERAINSLKKILILNDYNEDNYEGILHKFTLAKKGDFPFTLILEDPTGLSKIIPSHKGQKLVIEQINLNTAENKDDSSTL